MVVQPLPATGRPAALNSYMPENSYYESNNITVATTATNLTVAGIAPLPANDEYIISTLGYTSTYDRMLCFVLNERARELCGEFKRWEDCPAPKHWLPGPRLLTRMQPPTLKISYPQAYTTNLP